jgi:hypothetical protein
VAKVLRAEIAPCHGNRTVSGAGGPCVDQSLRRVTPIKPEKIHTVSALLSSSWISLCVDSFKSTVIAGSIHQQITVNFAESPSIAGLA